MWGDLCVSVVSTLVITALFYVVAYTVVCLLKTLFFSYEYSGLRRVGCVVGAFFRVILAVTALMAAFIIVWKEGLIL